jgi:hypothetical protein
MLRFFRNLLIFGEGGDGGGAGAAPGGAPAGQAAENTGVQVPDAGEQRRLTKEERRARLEERLKAEQTQAQPQQPQQTQEAPEQPKRPFKELIRGEYKQEADEYVQNLLNGRFKGVREAEARSKRMEGFLTQLVAEKYNLQPGEDGKLDLDAVQKAMDDDDDLYEGLAMELGTSTETARKFAAMQKQIDADEEERKARENYARYMFLQNAAQEAQKTYPDMNVEETAKDPRFQRLLEVLSPAAAYHALHQVELTTNAMQYAVDTTKAGISASIQAGQNRPSEGGLGRQAPANTTRIEKHPREMTRAERAAIKRRAARGEEVIF